MRVVVAPERIEPIKGEIRVFLGGGITGCENWQQQTLEHLQKLANSIVGDSDQLVVFNPRRAEFPLNDASIAIEQIQWEFDMLESCDIFSMYFCQSQIQPICLYELGRNLLNMKLRFPKNYLSRICITCPKNYERANDVQIQTSLALFGNTTKFNIDEYCFIDGRLSPETHAELIMNCTVALLRIGNN